MAEPTPPAPRVLVRASERGPAFPTGHPYNVHRHDEEWMLVLAGRGVAAIGDAEHEIGPGDFLGFPPGVAHEARSAGGEDLVYLQGGDAWSRSSVEIVDFPRLGLRKTFVGTRLAATFRLDAAREAAAAEER
jgi:uncharacterized cupin superfamily protein